MKKAPEQLFPIVQGLDSNGSGARIRTADTRIMIPFFEQYRGNNTKQENTNYDL